MSLLQEFEDKIYTPRKPGSENSPLLKKGKETFEFIEKYLKSYDKIFGGGNYDETGNTFQYDNLLKVMLTGLPSNDWMPPLLCYFEKFKHEMGMEFLTKLNNKFSADWISQYSPTKRIANMNQIISIIESKSSCEDVLSDKCFDIDSESFKRVVESAVYGRRFTRFLLLMLDYYYQDHSHQMSIETLSVEHILPQNPKADSLWKKIFSEEERAEWTDRLGNLVMITSRKNSSQGRLDYKEKRDRYFEKRITTCPNSLRLLHNNQWTPLEVAANQDEVTKKIYANYAVR